MISLFPALRVSHLEKKKIIGQWRQTNDYSPLILAILIVLRKLLNCGGIPQIYMTGTLTT